MNGRTDRQKYGQTKYPLYSTGHCPSRAAALLTIGKFGEKKEKQGKGTADHILTFSFSSTITYRNFSHSTQQKNHKK